MVKFDPVRRSATVTTVSDDDNDGQRRTKKADRYKLVRAIYEPVSAPERR